MPRSRLVWELVAAFLAVSLLVVFAVTAWVTWRFSQQALEEASDRLEAEVRLIEALIERLPSDPESRADDLERLAAAAGRRIQLYSSGLELQLDTRDEAAITAAPLDTRSALARGAAELVIVDETDGERWLYRSVRLETDPETTVLRVGAPVVRLQPSVRRASRTLAVAAVAGALLSVVLFLLVANRLIVPVLGELNRLEGVRRDFVANVSHELKTPITAARGMVETMLEDPEMEADTRRMFLFRIRDQLGRLSALVGDLLVLSRIESEGQKIEKTVTDLRAVALDCVNALWPELENKRLRLERQLPAEPVLVEGDPPSLRQAIGNLLDNAVKYSPAGGALLLGLRSESGRARLWVTDEGPGIDPSQHDRIFERFYRVDTARSRSLGGTGLGLSIVKHVALAHGGNVEVDSTPGQGSTFTLTFPLASDRRSEAAASPAPDAS